MKKVPYLWFLIGLLLVPLFPVLASDPHGAAEGAKALGEAAMGAAGAAGEAAHGAAETGATAAGHVDFSGTFLFIGLMLLLAKMSGLIERWGQPSVLGELAIGIILGNLALINFDFFEQARNNEVLRFLGEMGLLILLFQAGLESNVTRILKAGPKALGVATTGAVVPFLLGGFLIGPWILPGQSQNEYLFIGACMASTSVAIAAQLFRSYRVMKTDEAQIVLGSAVLDDVFGMVMLPVMTALVTAGSISPATVAIILVKSLSFMIGAVVLGRISAPYLSQALARLNTGQGMKLTMALSLALILAYLAHLVGMSPIIGAFAAGLFLDPVHFKHFDDPQMAQDIQKLVAHETFNERERGLILKAAAKHSHHHIEDLIEPIAHLTVPLFFILVGMNVDLTIFTDIKTLLIACGVMLIPLVSRVIAAFTAGRGMDRGVIAFALIPNDEVGLVFASVARSLGVFDDQVFTIVVFVLIMTTLIGSAGLNFFLSRYTAKRQGELGDDHDEDHDHEEQH